MTKRMLIYMSVLMLCCCTKQSVQATYDKQETIIDNLVQNILGSDESATVEYLSGPVRIRLGSSTSTEEDTALEKGGKVSFYYGGYVLSSASLSSSNLFATNLEELASASGWKNVDESMFELQTVTVGKGELVPGLEKGLPGVRKGDVVLILFSGKYGWGNHSRGTIPARSALAYQIWVTDVSNE